MARVPRWLLAILIVALPGGVGCTTALRPFTARPVVWSDHDLDGWGPRPPPRRGSAVWDATDGLFFRPQVRALSLPRARESVDVNALDEVPDSSWFANRIGTRSMTAGEVARAACPSVDATPARPWRVVDVKPDGVQPGFVIQDAQRRRWLLKIDHAEQPERATAADVVVAALLHAAGYHVPCNRIVFFRSDDLRADRDGPAPEQIRRIVEAAVELPDGRRRASVSAFVDGEPLGPWSYTGVWEADYNDRVPHELRRELRALRYFAAWVDHVDARSQNTLSFWVGDRHHGHVRHALIDFGDSLGATDPDPRRSVRYGHSTWLDPTAALEDLLTLGLLPRPWYRESASPSATLGDYAEEPFVPDEWCPNYWNGAFERADATDAAWAARILARFEPAHLRAVVQLARFSDPDVTERLVDALSRRREAILEAHLSKRSPLVRPRIDGRRLCVEDAAVVAGIRRASDREDRARARWLEGRAASSQTVRSGASVCVDLPAQRGDYLIVDVYTETPDLDQPGPARLHLAPMGRGYRVIGLERPARSEVDAP